MKPSFKPDNPPQHVREARLRSLVNLATTPMLVFDHDRRYVEVNDTAAEVMGAPREEILGRRIDDFTAGEGGFDLERLWARFMEDGRVNGSYPIRRLDGQVKPVVYAATANVVPGRHMAIFANGKNGGSSQTTPPATPPGAPRSASSLTPREREILQLMSEGLPNKTIASRLSISERTVTTHVANIYAKLHVNNRVSAIQEAMRRRILDYNP